MSLENPRSVISKRGPVSIQGGSHAAELFVCKYPYCFLQHEKTILWAIKTGVSVKREFMNTDSGRKWVGEKEKAHADLKEERRGAWVDKSVKVKCLPLTQGIIPGT